MIQILQNLWGYAQTAFQFLLNIVSTIYTSLAILVSSVAFPQALIPFMPTIIGASITITLVVFAAKFIIGR